MSAIHQQAMNYVYKQVLDKLLGQLGKTQRASLQLLIQRLVAAAGGAERLGDYRVMLACGAGKTSMVTLAFLRAAQLSLAARNQDTFRLRVASYHHAGMPEGDFARLCTSHGALFLQDDPRVELLQVDDFEVQPFDSRAGLADRARLANRMEILYSSHLFGGNVANALQGYQYHGFSQFLQRALGWQGGVDAWVVGDPPGRRARYLAWGRREAKRCGQRWPYTDGYNDSAFLEAFDACLPSSRPWLAHYRPVLPGSVGQRGRPVRVVPVDDLLAGPAAQLHRLVNSFIAPPTASTVMPARGRWCDALLHGHLQGLRAEHLQARPYAQGLAPYVWLGEPQSSPAQRRYLADYVFAHYRLNDTQQQCLLFAPFVNHGQALEAYLQHAHPGMLVVLPYLHKALRDKPTPDQVVQWLEDVSGLPIEALRHLYHQRTRGVCNSVAELRLPA
ncbi:hypothetical protein [Pseudomonas sp. nanlin1]|uniref:hypothetical protein n=1 Tax=Pseudomonas sp. nanlin1 TaxID=3040605 RepID=UPI00388DAE9F